MYALFAARRRVAFVLLEVAFLSSDFTSRSSPAHSSTTTPLFYRLDRHVGLAGGLAAAVADAAGRLVEPVLFLTRRRLRELAPYATAVLLGFGAFFAALLVFTESPFAARRAGRPTAPGLNPLLRDPGMMIHPPLLYSATRCSRSRSPSRWRR